MFAQADLDASINPYMEILERNLQHIYEKLMSIAEDTCFYHLKSQVPMNDEEKMH